MFEAGKIPQVVMVLRPWAAGAGRWVRAIRREFYEGGLDHRAMSLVYTSILSLAPLLAVGFSVLKAFGVHNELLPLLRESLAPLGEKADEVADRIIGFVENIQVGVLGFLGLAMLFYTVISLLGKIEESFNHIWRVSRPRSLGRRFSEYLSVILVGPVLLVSALGILASLSNTHLAQRLFALEPFGTIFYYLGICLSYGLIFGAFAFAYVFIPNTQVQLRSALAGGVVAGLLLKVIGSVFATFVADSAQYSAIYSGFAVFIVSIIWFYLTFVTLLLGGVVSFYVQYPRYLNYDSRHPRLSPRIRKHLALCLLVLIGQRHRRGGEPWQLHDLADAVSLPWEVVAEVLGVLQKGGLVLAVDGEIVSYLLAKDSEQVLLSEVFQLLEEDGVPALIGPVPGDANDAVGKVLAAHEAALAGSYPAVSLREVLMSLADAKLPNAHWVEPQQ